MIKTGVRIKKEKGAPDFTLFSTGSEVSLALEAAVGLEKLGKHAAMLRRKGVGEWIHVFTTILLSIIVSP